MTVANGLTYAVDFIDDSFFVVSCMSFTWPLILLFKSEEIRLYAIVSMLPPEYTEPFLAVNCPNHTNNRPSPYRRIDRRTLSSVTISEAAHQARQLRARGTREHENESAGLIAAGSARQT
jgi:hypothetical protein